MASSNQKCSFVALIGAPNAGKSTLTNLLVGQKISIVSPKAQTTRNAIKAIFIEGDTQLVFIDTPGLFIPRKNLALERMIVRSAWQAIKEVDQVCLLIDATQGFSDNIKNIIEDLKKHNLEPVIVINKIDLVKKNKLLEIIARLAEQGLEKIFMISALNGDGVEDLKKHLLNQARPGPWAFSGEEISDAPMKFIASEITREKLFIELHQDLPYSLCVKTDSWENLGNGDVKIHQSIYVLKESQKMIVIGKNGSMIRKIGEMARKDIAEALGIRKVHLFLFAKVKEDWMNEQENYSPE
jgi:GTP-binding protein Era